MKLARPMYNAHPYFSLKNLGKKCALYTAKYSNFEESANEAGAFLGSAGLSQNNEMASSGCS